jgi:hypothetical protein
MTENSAATMLLALMTDGYRWDMLQRSDASMYGQDEGLGASVKSLEILLFFSSLFFLHHFPFFFVPVSVIASLVSRYLSSHCLAVYF